MRLWLTQAVAPLLTTLLAVACVFVLGDRASLCLHERTAATPFADIRVEPPPGMSREDFLAEVQYQSDLPDQLLLTDTQILARVEQAFARHAWVEKIQRVEMRGQKLTVEARYRRPALIVPCPDGPRVLDRNGIVLPASARGPDLPVYQGPPPAAVAPTGSRWTETEALACAVVVGYVPAEWLGVGSATVDRRGVVLGLRDGSRVIWGRPPGDEAANESTAAVKRHRWQEQPGAGELDLRPLGAVAWTPSSSKEAP